MLQMFLATNRAELIARCKAKAAKRVGRTPLAAGGAHGVPLLLEQIGDNLALDRNSHSGKTGEAAVSPTDSDFHETSGHPGVGRSTAPRSGLIIARLGRRPRRRRPADRWR
jgi:hypothetical protein